MHDDLNIYGFSSRLIAGFSKPVAFLKFSVLREILMLLESTLFEFLLSCHFSKIRKIPEWKDLTILVIVKFFLMESLFYFEILIARNAWVL